MAANCRTDGTDRFPHVLALHDSDHVSKQPIMCVCARDLIASLRASRDRIVELLVAVEPALTLNASPHAIEKWKAFGELREIIEAARREKEEDGKNG